MFVASIVLPLLAAFSDQLKQAVDEPPLLASLPSSHFRDHASGQEMVC